MRVDCTLRISLLAYEEMMLNTMHLRRTRPFIHAAWALACMSLFTACHSSAVQRALSPLIGSWVIDGPTPQPDARLPRFTRLHFARNGSLDAAYVAAGGALSAIVPTAPKVMDEQDHYSLLGRHGLRIIEGSRALSYQYDVRDGRLFLRASDSGDTTVFRRPSTGGDTSEDSNESNDAGDQHTSDSDVDTK